MEQPLLEQKVNVLEAFLIDRLNRARKNQEKIPLVEVLCHSICSNGEAFNMKQLAAETGFSVRYIQQLFMNYVGISPQSFYSVHRFNKSLELVRSANTSLTDIAYECGYYDQAHFIKEFKAYTGITPSQLFRCK
jgi:AraC-like DNA-binding protein